MKPCTLAQLSLYLWLYTYDYIHLDMVLKRALSWFGFKRKAVTTCILIWFLCRVLGTCNSSHTVESGLHYSSLTAEAGLHNSSHSRSRTALFLSRRSTTAVFLSHIRQDSIIPLTAEAGLHYSSHIPLTAKTRCFLAWRDAKVPRPVSTHTHAHTHIYIYIYTHIYIMGTKIIRQRERARKRRKPYTSLQSVFSIDNNNNDIVIIIRNQQSDI